MDKIDRIKNKNDNVDEKPMSVSQEQVVERAKSGCDGGCKIQVSKENSSDNENANIIHHCNENHNNNNHECR